MEYEQLAPKNEMGFSVGISIFPGVYSFYSTHFQVHFFKNVFSGGGERLVLDIPNGCSMRRPRISRGWFSTIARMDDTIQVESARLQEPP